MLPRGKRIQAIHRQSRQRGCRGTSTYLLVPTLVPKPGSPTVTQGNLSNQESDAIRALGLPWVMLNRDICLLKIRVSVVRLIRIGLGLFSVPLHGSTVVRWLLGNLAQAGSPAATRTNATEMLELTPIRSPRDGPSSLRFLRPNRERSRNWQW